MKTIGQLVEEHCTRKLAQILYERAGCSQEDRALLDWQTAENFVRMNSIFVDSIVRDFISQQASEQISGMTQAASIIILRLDMAYENFDRLCGQAVLDNLYRMIRPLLRTPYTGIRLD